MICEYTNIHSENPLLTKDGLSFKILKKPYSPVLHSRTVFV